MNGDFEKRLNEITKEIKRLTEVIETLANVVAKLADHNLTMHKTKRLAFAKQKLISTTAAAKAKGKSVAKKKTVAKKKPLKAIKKREAAKGRALTPTDEVLAILKRFKKGISLEALRKKSGLSETTNQ